MQIILANNKSVVASVVVVASFALLCIPLAGCSEVDDDAVPFVGVFTLMVTWLNDDILLNYGCVVWRITLCGAILALGVYHIFGVGYLYNATSHIGKYVTREICPRLALLLKSVVYTHCRLAGVDYAHQVATITKSRRLYG